MRKRHRACAHGILLICTLGIAACASPGKTSPDSAHVRVYKYTGALQCRPGSGIPLTELERQLTSARVRVVRSECGNTGGIYPAVCDVPGGDIGIIEIHGRDADLAESLGFRLLERDLPDAKTGSCG